MRRRQFLKLLSGIAAIAHIPMLASATPKYETARVRHGSDQDFYEVECLGDTTLDAIIDAMETLDRADVPVRDRMIYTPKGLYWTKTQIEGKRRPNRSITLFDYREKIGSKATVGFIDGRESETWEVVAIHRGEPIYQLIS